MGKAIVLYPSPPIGHLISMVELGKLMLTHNPSLIIHILIATPPYRADSTSPYISSVARSLPSINFLHLPAVPLHPSSAATHFHHEALTLEVLCFSNPHVHRALHALSQKHTIQAFVIDFFCTAALAIGAELGIPTYHFFTSGAACLAFHLYFPRIHEATAKSFKDLEEPLDYPGVPVIRGSDLPKPMLDRDDEVYQCFLEFSRQFPKSAGVLVNTFELLEPRAIKAMADGICGPHGRSPPVYAIGPLIAAGGRSGGDEGPHPCLAWLDTQPRESVVFLCFGSLGLFSKAQLQDIAVGLERSGQRFLWVVRNPPAAEGQSVAISDQAEPDLDSLLPDGFLDRTKEKGLVVKSWAPQVQVLSHASVGGFVTHCGWNSVLEAVHSGVPMVAWPLYAEQRFNKVLMVEEIKIALPLSESKHGCVSSSEIEKRIRELMQTPEGEAIREQTKAMKDAAKAALREGGASHSALAKLVGSWKK